VFYDKKKIIERNLHYQFEGIKSNENTKLIYEELLNIISSGKFKRRIGLIVIDLVGKAFGENDKRHLTEEIEFRLGHDNGLYLLYFAEKLTPAEVNFYENTILIVNDYSLSDLKDLYKEIITNGPLEKGYMLNWIERKRYSRNDILYNKESISGSTILFEIILQFS